MGNYKRELGTYKHIYIYMYEQEECRLKQPTFKEEWATIREIGTNKYIYSTCINNSQLTFKDNNNNT